VIYFDAAYIAKCYLNEPASDIVRQFAYAADGLASCEIARVEFYSVLRRHLREGNITSQEKQDVLRDFEQDEIDGVWKWLPVDSSLIRSACEIINTLPPATFLRAVDAIHLACARKSGFGEVYTNDRHMLACAHYFDVRGVNLIP
jgi:predicted nucleic acid-binding protein